MNLANWYHDRGQYEQAEPHYRKALALVDPSAQSLLAATLQHNWVNFLFHLGKTPVAREACYAWLHHSLRHHHPEQQAAALNYLALLAEQEGKQEAQAQYLNQAIYLLKSLKTLKTPHLLPQFLLNRAVHQYDRQKFIPAQLEAEEALRLSEELSNNFLIASAHLLLSKVYRDRKKQDWDQSEKHLDLAHQDICDNQYRTLLWEAEFERGRLEKIKQNLQAANTQFQKALAALQLVTEPMPEAYRKYFLRDRKLERIKQELSSVN